MAIFLLLMSLLSVMAFFCWRRCYLSIVVFFIRDSSTACPMAFFLLMMLVLLANWPPFCLWFHWYLSNGILSIADVSANCPIAFFLLITSVSPFQSVLSINDVSGTCPMALFYWWRQCYLSNEFFSWWRQCSLSNDIFSVDDDCATTCPMAFFLLLMSALPVRWRSSCWWRQCRRGACDFPSGRTGFALVSPSLTPRMYKLLKILAPSFLIYQIEGW